MTSKNKDKKVPVLIADFETTVVHDTKDIKIDDLKSNYSTRVWQAAFSNLDKEDHMIYSDSIDEFMFKIMTYGGQGGAHIFFHNLGGFDGAFIWDWALKNGYEYVDEKEYCTGDKKIVGDIGRFTIFKNDKIFNFYDTFDMIKSNIDGMSKAIAKDENTDVVKGETPLYTEEELAARTPEQIAYDDWYIKIDVETLKKTVKKYMVAECVDHKIYTQSNLAQQALDLDYEGFEVWYLNKYGKEFDGSDLDLTELIPYRRSTQITAFTNHLKAKPIKKVRNKEVYQQQIGWERNINNELKPKYIEIDKDKYKALQKELPKVKSAKKNYNDINWLDEKVKTIIKSPIKLTGIKHTTDQLSALTKYMKVYEEDKNQKAVTEKEYHQAKAKFNQIMTKHQAIINNKFGKHAFKGGLNIVNPIYQGKKLEKVIVFDINSMYPWILRTMYLPQAEGKFVKIKDINDLDEGKLYIVNFKKLKATIKEDWIPFIKYRTNEIAEDGLSNDLNFIYSKFGGISQAEYYLNHIETESIYLTSVEVQKMMQAYNIEEYEIKNVKEYDRDYELENKMHRHVDFWMKVKKNANSELVRNYAKMMLNAVYGKLGNFDREYDKYSYQLSDEGVVEKLLQEDKQQPIRTQANVPAAAFITAYGRCYMAQMIHNVGVDKFVYCDTDSLHLTDWDEPEGLIIDKYELGAFKIEEYKKEALYIKCKTYGGMASDKPEGPFEFKCAAAGVHAKPDKDDFKVGNHIYDKKNIRVNGGMLLVDQKQNIGTINETYLYYQALYRNDPTSKSLVEYFDKIFDFNIQRIKNKKLNFDIQNHIKNISETVSKEGQQLYIEYIKNQYNKYNN